jgi:hypothetical protein
MSQSRIANFELTGVLALAKESSKFTVLLLGFDEGMNLLKRAEHCINKVAAE